MLLDAHAGVTYVRLCRPVGGPLSRRSGNESPERVEASAGTSSGFLAFSLAKRPDREKRTQFAKNNQVSGLWKVSGWSTFPVTSKGKPSDGPKRRETVGMVGWKVGKPAGRSNRRDGKPEGRFNPKPKGNRRRRAVGRPSGDPSGSSSGLTASRPQGLQPPRKRGERSSDRTAAGFGQRRSPIEVRSPAGQRTGLRTPRGLRLRSRLPRGFSRLDRHGPKSHR